MGLLFFIRAEETGTWDISSDNATWDTSSDNTTWDTSSFFVPKREEAQPVVFEVLFLHFYDMGHLFCTEIRHGTPLLIIRHGTPLHERLLIIRHGTPLLYRNTTWDTSSGTEEVSHVVLSEEVPHVSY